QVTGAFRSGPEDADVSIEYRGPMVDPGVKGARRMRRTISVAMALLLMLSFVAGIQPVTGSAQSTETTGQAVTITDAAGNPWVGVSVDSFTADFTGYSRNYAPDRGFQYAHITV